MDRFEWFLFFSVRTWAYSKNYFFRSDYLITFWLSLNKLTPL